MKNSSNISEPFYKKPLLWMRQLYNWVLHWAETPYAVPALFLIAFAESSFFPIPPDVLLIVLVLGIPKKAFKFATVCTIGSVLGGMFGYFIGYEFFGAVNWIMTHIVGESNWYGVMHQGTSPIMLDGYQFYYYAANSPYAADSSIFLTVKHRYDQNAFLALFAAAFSPIPYKVFTVAGGYFHINLLTLITASTIGRAGRFFLVSSLLYFYGLPMKKIIDKYFEWLALAFVILLIGGFLIIKKLI